MTDYCKHNLPREECEVCSPLPEQPSLFDPPPPPPTGPAAEPYFEEDSKPHKYTEWLATAEGQDLFARLSEAALLALRHGEKRFSVRGWVDSPEHKVRVNNAFSSWLADDLVTRYPQLLGLIERRVRKRVGPA